MVCLDLIISPDNETQQVAKNQPQVMQIDNDKVGL